MTENGAPLSMQNAGGTFLTLRMSRVLVFSVKNFFGFWGRLGLEVRARPAHLAGLG